MFTNARHICSLIRHITRLNYVLSGQANTRLNNHAEGFCRHSNNEVDVRDYGGLITTDMHQKDDRVNRKAIKADKMGYTCMSTSSVAIDWRKEYLSEESRLYDGPSESTLEPDMAVYSKVMRSTYLRIDLDAILNNIKILRRKCSPHTDVIAVLKANAYGHGSVEIARFLESQRIKHFAVATPEEGVQLRRAGVKACIQILGNASVETIPVLLRYSLTPTVSEIDFLQTWAQISTNLCQVVLKVDTGMSRNGCQPEQLFSLVQYCRYKAIPIHSIMTHFSTAWGNPDFTKHQLDTFMACAAKYRENGIKLHVSNSAGIINGYGVDLDFIRPGNCMYGLPREPSQQSIELMQSLGLRPVLTWLAHPTLVKQLPPGKYVGYENKYMTRTKETIATFSFGYADGYDRRLFEKAVISLDEYDVRCPVEGMIAMDAITVTLDKVRPKSTTFRVFTDDFTSPNSVTQIAATLKTVSSDVTTSLAARLPRVFVSKKQKVAVYNSLLSDT